MAFSTPSGDSSQQVDQASPGAPGQSFTTLSNTPSNPTTSACPPSEASGTYRVPDAAAGTEQSVTTATSVTSADQQQPASRKGRYVHKLTSQRVWTVLGGIFTVLGTTWGLASYSRSHDMSKRTVRNNALQTCREIPEAERDPYCVRVIDPEVQSTPRLRRALQRVDYDSNGLLLPKDSNGQINVGAVCVTSSVALAWMIMLWWLFTRPRGLDTPHDEDDEDGADNENVAA